MSLVKIVADELNTSGTVINTRVFKPLKSTVQNNSTRAVDTAEITLPITAKIKQNDIIKYIQDVTNVDSLVSIYNFKHSARDEGGFDIDGDDRTFTAPFVKETAARWDSHYCLDFGAAGQEITIAHDERHDFTGQFDITVTIKGDPTHFGGNSNDKEQVLFSKWDSAAGGNGVELGIKYTTTGSLWRVWAQVRQNAVETNLEDPSTDNFAAGSIPKTLRLTRDINDKVAIWFEGTEVASATVSGTLDAALKPSLIGTNSGGTLDYSGKMYQLRIYNGHLTSDEYTTIVNAKPQWSTMKINGSVWKCVDKTAFKTCSVKSINQILFKTILNKMVLDAGEPASPYAKATTTRVLNIFGTENSDDIIHDILGKVDENILFALGGGAGSASIVKYTATGTLLKNLEILTAFNENVFWFTSRKVLIMEVPQASRLRYDHSLGYKITDGGADDTSTVNDLEVIGLNVVKTKFENTGSAPSTKTISFPPIGVQIEKYNTTTNDSYNPVVWLDEGSQFSVDFEKGVITFTPALTGVEGARIWYQYEADGDNIKRKLGSNIAEIGRYARRLIIPQIRDGGNLQTLANAIVSGAGIARQNVNQRYQLIAPLLINSIRENIQPTIKNIIKGIDTTSVIRSITYEYPKMRTTIELGEHLFDSFDLQKRLVEQDESSSDSSVKTKNV